MLTTIVGAAIGANLLLLALDIVWDRRARDRYAARSTEAFEARPSIG